MIETLIELSIRNRFLVLILAAVLTVAGVYATLNTPVDAIPDLSENQVIVFADWMGRSPREIEDQVTYPLSRKLQGLAGVKAVRSSSEFNFSMITIIFEDDVDFYFARQRVTEKLSQANTFLPAGLVPYLAPDATALGQIYWYTVETSPLHPLDSGRLWALNKFYIAPQLNSASGVADVAIVGGTPLEYQIDVRPEDLRAYGITLGEMYAAVAQSNMPGGGGVVQKNNAEYIVRGVGWIKGKEDIEKTVIKQVEGTPVFVENVATVQLGTQFRRSVFEKDGNEVTGGAVLMRHGENPLAVTERVKEKIQELQPGLPPGIHIVAAYDRTRLIRGAIHTLTEVMWHEMLIASLAILLILMHFRSVFVICVTLPLSVLFSFLLMWVLRQTHIIDIQANIMSLAGITISIGILVDQAIVMTENATHHLKAHFGDRQVTGDIRELVIEPCRTVGRPIFFSVLIMLLSFIPVFMLSGREGKLFHPLGLHQELRHDRRGLDLGYVGPGADSHFHQGTPAERGGELDRPQLHPHLQAAADLGLAAAEPGDVDVRGAADPGGRHVPVAGHSGHGRLGDRLAHLLPRGLLRRDRPDRHLHSPLVLASVIVGEPGVDRHVGLSLLQDRRGVHAGAGRRHDVGHAGHRAACQRDASGGRSQGTRRAAARVPGSGVGDRQGGTCGYADRPGPAGYGRNRSSTSGRRNSGRSGCSATTTRSTRRGECSRAWNSKASCNPCRSQIARA